MSLSPSLSRAYFVVRGEPTTMASQQSAPVSDNNECSLYCSCVVRLFDCRGGAVRLMFIFFKCCRGVKGVT